MSTLLIDADDTLWENIVVFNAVNRKYVEWLLPTRTIEEMQPELDALQIEFIATHGYGRATFELSLVGGIERFAGRAPTDADRAHIAELVRPLRWDRLDLLDGVADTLARLHESCQLLLVTKGDPVEQQHKIDRSGLAGYFKEVEILANKTPAEYRRIVEHHQLDTARAWMVGNSPRSDITPALEVGLGAVFIPHAETWSHEEADLPEHQRLIRLDSFSELLGQFA